LNGGNKNGKNGKIKRQKKLFQGACSFEPKCRDTDLRAFVTRHNIAKCSEFSLHKALGKFAIMS
jgi:hypothetical protein